MVLSAPIVMPARARPLARLAGLLLLSMTPTLMMAQGTTEVIQFNGFNEGDLVRDQYMFRGVRFPADINGGPFIDDGGTLAFLLDSPPGLLSLSPFAYSGGPGQVHASVGTYVFDFVDPGNPFAPSFTDRVEVAIALIDKGLTVLRAYDAAGDLVASQTLELPDFTFFYQVMTVSAPGIRQVTLSTPQIQPTLGCLVDTLVYSTPVALPARAIDIDLKPGSPRNLIRLGDRGLVDVAILSGPGFEPALLDVAKILLQRASPVSFRTLDRNRDRIPDLVVGFPIAALDGLTTSTTQVRLTAIDVDGTPLEATAPVTVTSGPVPHPVTAPLRTAGPS